MALVAFDLHDVHLSRYAGIPRGDVEKDRRALMWRKPSRALNVISRGVIARECTPAFSQTVWWEELAPMIHRKRKAAV